MSAKSCCIKIKNCGGVILGNLQSEIGSGNSPSKKQLTKALEFFKGVQDATLFALEKPETDNPFTPAKEVALSELIDSLVEMSADFNAPLFTAKVKELMELNETI
jgi:hypothetical protein